MPVPYLDPQQNGQRNAITQTLMGIASPPPQTQLPQMPQQAPPMAPPPMGMPPGQQPGGAPMPVGGGMPSSPGMAPPMPAPGMPPQGMPPQRM